MTQSFEEEVAPIETQIVPAGMAAEFSSLTTPTAGSSPRISWPATTAPSRARSEGLGQPSWEAVTIEYRQAGQWEAS